MARLNLSSDDVRNYEKQRSLKKEILNLTYKEGLSFDKFRVSKTPKSAKKASKTQSGNKF